MLPFDWKKDAKSASGREYYLRNKEKVCEASRQWALDNKEKRSAAAKQWRLDNKDKIRDRINRKRAADPETTKAIERVYARRYRYGIKSQEEWDEIFTSQGNCCNICKTDTPGNKNGWCTDHDHNTTKSFRGILCHHCNQLLRNAKDSPDILQAAMKYLQTTAQKG